MINVYVMDTNGLPDPQECPEIMGNLSETRQQKILRHCFADDRKESLGAGLLLYQVLKQYGKSMDEIYLGRYDKPEIEGLFFNLSHSHGKVVCAAGERPVGCDIQKIMPEPKHVANRFFHENEKRYLERFLGKSREEEFCRLWTMKESFVKMTGDGLHLDFRAFEVRECSKIYKEDVVVPCFLKEYGIEGYHLTVCSEDSIFAEEVQEVMDFHE